MKASEQLSARLAGPTPEPSKHLPFWQAPEQGCGWLGRGLSAQGNRSPRSASRGDFPRLLPPTQRLPPSDLDLDQHFQPSPHGCTTQSWAGLRLSGEAKTRAEPRINRGSLVAAHLSLLLRTAPSLPDVRKGTELRGQKWSNFYLSPLVWFSLSESRGFWD